MGEILGWPPIVWLLRVVISLGLLATAWIGALYLLRFFRRENIKKLAKGDLPDLEELTILGSLLAIKTRKDKTQDQQIGALDARLREIEEKHMALERLLPPREEN